MTPREALRADTELGAAWRRGIEALPEGWTLRLSSLGSSGASAAQAMDLRSVHGGAMSEEADTPTAALDALTARIGERSA